MVGTPQEAPASDGVVVDDLPCLGCGYNLRTLTWAGRCPECNRAVRESARLPGFRFASRGEGLRVRRGLLWFVVSIVMAAGDDIGGRLGFRFFHLWPNGAWRWCFCFWWTFGHCVTLAVEIAAIWLILGPRSGEWNRLNNRWRWAAILLAALHLCGYGACRLVLWGVWYGGGDHIWVVYLVSAWGRSSVLLILLASLFRVVAGHGVWRLRFLGGCSLLATAMVLVWEVYLGLNYTCYSFYRPWSFTAGQTPWWLRALENVDKALSSVVGWLPEGFLACAWIVILLFVWAFERRLDAAVRAGASKGLPLEPTSAGQA